MRILSSLALFSGLSACLNSTEPDADHPTRQDDTGEEDGGEDEGGGDESGGDEGGGSEGGGNESGGDEGGGDEGGDGGSTEFLPDEGSWTFVDGSIVSDSCAYDYDELPSGGDGFVLLRQGGHQFTMVLDGATDGFSCAWAESQDFQCDALTGSEEIDELSATVVSETTITGSFDRTDALTSYYDIAVDCIGDDCDWVEYFGDINFPCRVELELIANWDG